MHFYSVLNDLFGKELFLHVKIFGLNKIKKN